MKRQNSAWKTSEVAGRFTSVIRGAVPFADAQMDTLLRVINAAKPEPGAILDVGCGDGILGKAILEKRPSSRCVFFDFSEPMIQAARKNLEPFESRAEFIAGDFGVESWTQLVKAYGSFDIVVSGFAIHHQTDERKMGIYKEVYGLLNPGGVFLNLDHVSSSTEWVEKIFDTQFIDSLCEAHFKAGSNLSRDEIASRYYHRPDKQENILATVRAQLEWLRETGYQNVDCYYRMFALALFGGTKPDKSPVIRPG